MLQSGEILCKKKKDVEKSQGIWNSICESSQE